MPVSRKILPFRRPLPSRLPHPMDRLRFILAQVFLTDVAADQRTTVAGFLRRVTTIGKTLPNSITLTLTSDRYKLLTIVAHRLDDGHWRVACADLNLPALVFGHNGRPIRTIRQLALALTRALHFMKLVTRPECHGHLIPGVGTANQGYVKYVECMVQIQDPGHFFLLASHTAHFPYQHKSPLVCWGQWTNFKTVKSDFAFYDKAAQRRAGEVLPAGIDGTRIEYRIKTPDHLAAEAARTKNFQGTPGEVVRTLSLATSYDVLRHRVSQMAGWGMTPDVTLRSLPVAARHIALGLGTRITKPHAVDKALADYRTAFDPCESTLRNVTKHLRAYAMTTHCPEPHALLPETMDQLQWSDVTNGWAELEFKNLLSSTEAPMEPCPEILAAWSNTTFLKRKPTGVDLVGHTAPTFSQPWRKNVL